MSEPRSLQGEWYEWTGEQLEDSGYGSTRLADLTFDVSSLPEDVRIQFWYLNGHGPLSPDRRSLIFYEDRGFLRADYACDVAECRKCIAGYKEELNFPYYDEEEVFV